MQVIGAGMSRTGTMSTHAALERLGLRCYHMTEVARADGHLNEWNAFLHGRAEMDWAALFSDYEATVDTPACLFYKDLMSAFPAAKVLLNVRDPQKWYASLVTLASALESFRPLAAQSERLADFLRVTDAVGEKLSGGNFSEANCIRAYNQHNEKVCEEVPEERLLVFRVEDGWDPLCRFLDKPVPPEPFPYLNEGPATINNFVNDALL